MHMITAYGDLRNYYYEIGGNNGWLEAKHDYDAYRKVLRLAKGNKQDITYLAEEYDFDCCKRRTIPLSLIENGIW